MVDGIPLLNSSSAPTRGLVMMGPSATATYPASVSCSAGACTTLYSSANDPNSTCSLEENGPVKAVIRCVGTHMDSAGHPYMHFTVRETFYLGKSSVKVTSVLRNADYDTSTMPSSDCGYDANNLRCQGGTFNTAFKGFQSYELRLAADLSGELSYAFGTDGAPLSGTMGATDSAYLCQGQSNFMVADLPGDCFFGSPCAQRYTPDVGYSIHKNSTVLASGDQTAVPTGWADISDSAGHGLEIGVYQMAAYWPKSLELGAGGSDVRIGIYPSMNSQPIYQAWPAWSIHDLWLNFHSKQLATPGDEFLRFQHYLLARPPLTYVNSTGVFPYPIVDPVVESNYYYNAYLNASPPVNLSTLCFGGTLPCQASPDRNVTAPNLLHTAGLYVYRDYAWSSGGPLNQEEFRWSDLQKFLQQGYTGRWLNSAHFYRFVAEKVMVHSDGVSSTDPTVNAFRWRDRDRRELDNWGMPALSQAGDYTAGIVTNSAYSSVSWPWSDHLHHHVYGILDYYFLTGDETIHEAIVPYKDYSLFDGYQQSPVIARHVGITLMSGARLAEFLAATGDPDASTVLAKTTAVFENRLKPETCLSGFPAGCTQPSIPCPNGICEDSDPIGMSYTRGQPTGSRGEGWCPAATGTNYFRIGQPFETSIEEEGALSLRHAQNSTWSDYHFSLDLAFGMGMGNLTEQFGDDGTTSWQGATFTGNGFRYEAPLDFSSYCDASVALSTEVYQCGDHKCDIQGSALNNTQGVWFNFYTRFLTTRSIDWKRKFDLQLVKASQGGVIVWPPDYGSYQIGALIEAIQNAPKASLKEIPLISVTSDGNGSQTLTFQVPAGSLSPRLKYDATRSIQADTSKLLDFDQFSQTFGIDPVTHVNWFAATDATASLPAWTPGIHTVTLKTGANGLDASHFSLKAEAP
jgi:hypothetical protein